MSLSDLSIPRKTLPTSLGEIVVRGITAHDIGILFANYGEEVREAAKFFLNEDSEDYSAVIAELPGVVAGVIACCCDEPDEAEKALALPVAIQVEAIDAIFSLSVEEAGGLKKLIASITRLMTTLTSSMTETAATGGEPSGAA